MPSFKHRPRCSLVSASLISNSTSLTKSLASFKMNVPFLSTLPVTARKQQMARWVGATDFPT